jgi:beta-galactosidase/beta-glucuronidase
VDSIVSLSGDADTYFNANDQAEMRVRDNGDYRVTFKSGRCQQVVVDDLPRPLVLSAPWQVSFNKAYGYDGTLEFPELIDWKNHSSEQVKYYSGTATYQTRFSVVRSMLRKDQSLVLDLGQVAVAARVFVNGQDEGVLWKAPYQVDISDVVTAGENQLTLEVTNVWTNRLIGDERYPDTSGYRARDNKMPDWYTDNQAPPASQRLTFCATPFYKASDELASSGLIGPVRITINKIVILDR